MAAVFSSCCRCCGKAAGHDVGNIVWRFSVTALARLMLLRLCRWFLLGLLLREVNMLSLCWRKLTVSMLLSHMYALSRRFLASLLRVLVSIMLSGLGVSVLVLA